ncbi:MAG: OmpA family protein [Pseudobdellovibrio sp.]
MRKKLLSSLLATALLLTETTYANVLGDFQTFVPNTDGLFFITVDSGQTLKKHTIVGNAYLSYAKDYLLVYDNLTNQKRVNYKDSVLSLDGTVGYSLTDNLQLFMGLTHLVDYKADDSQATQYTLTKGTHSFRPGVKWKFNSEKDSHMALLFSVDALNVKNDPYTGENPPAIYNIGYAWSTRFNGAGTHGFNLGYRHRNPGDITVDSTFYPLKSQLTFSYGYSYPWSPKTRLVFETIGCYPFDKGGNKKAQDISCLELLGAARYRLNNTWAFVGGATVEPGLQTMAPAYRVFAGMNVYLYPNWSKSTESKVAGVEPLSVPERVEISPKEVYQIPIYGGKPNYNCSLVEGTSLSQLSGCIYTAPPYADTARVEVTDQSGQSRTIEIVTLDDAPETKATDMALKPETARMYTGTQEVFNAEGGYPPYTYKVVTGGGRIDIATGHYTAPLKPAFVTIQATDTQGNSRTSTIEVVEPPKANKVVTLKGVNFIFNTTTLVKPSKAKLEKAIKVLSGMNIKEIIVAGHTDNIGSAEYNRDLSERRAAAIAKILVQRLGLSSSQVKSVGYGLERPLVPNVDDNSRLENRRVELLIYTNK